MNFSEQCAITSMPNDILIEKTNMSTVENKLRRQDRIVAGVCGGLGAFFGVRPFWFRLLFVLLLLPGGLPGLLPYIVLWIIVPKRR